MPTNPMEELDALLEKINRPALFESLTETPAPESTHRETTYHKYGGGPLVTYIGCPVCGLNRPMEKTGGGHDRRTMRPGSSKPIKTGEVSFSSVDLEQGRIIQEREAAGKKGFPLVNSGNFKTFIERYPDLAEQIRSKCAEILTYF